MNLSKDPKSVIVSFMNLDDTISMSEVNREWHGYLVHVPMHRVLDIAQKTVANLNLSRMRELTKIGWRKLQRNDNNTLQSVLPEQLCFWGYDKEERPRRRPKMAVDKEVPCFDHYRWCWGMLWLTKVSPYLRLLNAVQLSLLSRWYDVLKATGCGYISHFAAKQTLYMRTRLCETCGFMTPMHYFATESGCCSFCSGEMNRVATMKPRMIINAAARNLGVFQNGMELC